MKWMVLAAAAFFLCAHAAQASSCSIDYSVDFSIPPISGVGVQPALVTGDICTDGTVGALNANDIVSWDLTLSDSWNSETPDFTLSSTNPDDDVDLYLLNTSTPLEATASELTWDFEDPGSNAYAILYFRDSDTTNYIALNDYDDGTEFTDYSYGDTQVANYGPTESGVVDLTPVPEPTSLALLISGVLGVGFMRRDRLRATRR